MGFSRQECWKGFPFPLQGIFPTQGLNPQAVQFSCRQVLYHRLTWEAKTLTFLIEGEMCMSAESLQSCPTLRYSVDCSPSGSLSMGFSRQEYWSGLPCCSPGNLPNPGTEPASLMFPALPGRFFTSTTTLKRVLILNIALFFVEWCSLKIPPGASE